MSRSMGTKTIYSASYLIDQNRIWLTMNSLPSFNRSILCNQHTCRDLELLTARFLCVTFLYLRGASARNQASPASRGWKNPCEFLRPSELPYEKPSPPRRALLLLFPLE